MKRFAMLMPVLVLMTGCNSTRIIVDDPGSDNEKYGSTVLWATAISYPDGYDWMKDKLGGDVQGCRILTFRNNRPVLTLEASKDGLIRPEADLHRIVDGHLYSNCSTDEGWTYLLVDGQESFCFEGRESIDCIMVRGTDIYTLGCCRDTEGWSFRKNGELVFGQNKGKLLSPLFEDEGKLCFCWATPLVSSSEKTAWRYYTMADGVQKQVLYASDIKDILSIRIFHGQTHFLAISSILDEILWEDESGCTIIDGTTSSGTPQAELFVSSDRLLAHINVKNSFISIRRDVFYDKNNIVYAPAFGLQLCSGIHDTGRLGVACCIWGGTDRIRLWAEDGITSDIPNKYFMVCPDAFCSDGRHCSIGLNDSSDDRRPLVIHGEDTTRFDFNGYFTRLSLP